MKSSKNHLLFFPGALKLPTFYEPLFYVIRKYYFVKIDCYLPPGYGSRKNERLPLHHKSLAKEALEVRNFKGSHPIFIGHSWGCHIARSAALQYGQPCCLIEIDPRIHPLKSDSDINDIPEFFSSKEELLEAYFQYGFSEENIDWTWWTKKEDGSFQLNFNPKQVARMLDARPYFIATKTWETLSNANILIIPLGEGSPLTDEEIAKVRRELPKINIRVHRDIAHALYKQDQEKIGVIIGKWLNE